MESALITSPSRASARSTARSDLPAVVAPTTAISMAGWRPRDGGSPETGTGGRASGRCSASAGRHAEQDRRRRAGRGGRGRVVTSGGHGLAGFPGIARAGAPDLERGVVGPQVVRRGAGDAGG